MRGAQSPEVPLPPTVWPRPLSRRACTVGGSWGVRAPHCGLHGLPSRNRASPWAVTTSLSCPALGDNTACCPGSSTCHPDRPRIAGQEAATGRPRGGFSHGTVHGQVPSVDRACAQQGPDTTQQRGLVRTPSHRSDTCHPSPLGLPEVPLPHAPGGSWLPGAGRAGPHPSGQTRRGGRGLTCGGAGRQRRPGALGPPAGPTLGTPAHTQGPHAALLCRAEGAPSPPSPLAHPNTPLPRLVPTRWCSSTSPCARRGS